MNKPSLHTPGPWYVHREYNVFGGTNARLVATTGGYNDNQHQEEAYQENTANARLIAAAPDLLEVAKKLVDYRDRVGPLNFQLEKADDFIRMLRIAIDKAEGR